MHKLPLQLDSVRQTIACANQDWPDWHQGRRYYSCWCLLIEQEDVLQRLAQARHLLADALHPQPKRQAHVTLFVTGFPRIDKALSDDISLSQLQQQIHTLEQLQLPSFELRVNGFDSFASAAFLTVTPSNELQQIRAALQTFSQEIARQSYVPHITVGLYQRSVHQAELKNWHQQLQNRTLLLKVTKLSLCIFQAQDMFAQLDTLYQLSLANN